MCPPTLYRPPSSDVGEASQASRRLTSSPLLCLLSLLSLRTCSSTPLSTVLTVCVCVSLCARSFYQFTLPLPTSLWLTVTSVWLAVPPKSQIWFLLIFHVSGHILSLRRPFLVPIFERGGRPCCLHYRLLSHHSL